MRVRFSALLGTTLLCGALIGAAHAQPVPLPGQDPFYVAPANLSQLSNGALIRERPANFGLSPAGLASTLAGYAGADLGGLLPQLVQAVANGFVTYQVLYKSTDGAGQPVAEAATILVPNIPWYGTGSRPLVSYQTAEDSASNNCQPSYVIQTGFLAQGGGALSGSLESLFGLTALLKGYAVVYPDYEGPQSQWLAGPQAAHATLDGVRAVLQSGHGFSASTKVALWGYSGGGGATGWAAALARQYAPDLNIVGAAVGSPANGTLSTVLNNLNGGLLSGFVATGLVGLSRAESDLDVTRYLNDRGLALLKGAGDPNKCLVQEITTYATMGKIEAYTKTPQTPFTSIPVVKQILDRNSLSVQTTTPKIPVLSYADNFDDVIPISSTNDMTKRWCAAGSPVEVMRYSTPVVVDPTQLLIHVVGAVEGTTSALSYLTARFNGDTPRNDCSAAFAWDNPLKIPYLPGIVK